jgi:hypothetical protein
MDLSSTLGTASDLILQDHNGLALIGGQQSNLLIRKLKHLHDQGGLKTKKKH